MISRQKTDREKPEDQGADKIDRHEDEPGENAAGKNRGLSGGVFLTIFPLIRAPSLTEASRPLQ